MTDGDRAKGLLLDIGGVVILPGGPLINRWALSEPRLAELIEEWGGIEGPGDDLWHRMIAREVSERDYWADRAARIGEALGTATDTRALMNHLYPMPPADYDRVEVIELMRDVKAAGLPLGALTNDMADFHGRAWVDAQPWLELFDVVVDASVTGVMKPDPRAFAAGAAALGLHPRDIVYLDDMPWNVTGGEAAGLGAIAVSHGDAGPAVATARRRLGLER